MEVEFKLKFVIICEFLKQMEVEFKLKFVIICEFLLSVIDKNCFKLCVYILTINNWMQILIFHWVEYFYMTGQYHQISISLNITLDFGPQNDKNRTHDENSSKGLLTKQILYIYIY